MHINSIFPMEFFLCTRTHTNSGYMCAYLHDTTYNFVVVVHRLLLFFHWVQAQSLKMLTQQYKYISLSIVLQFFSPSISLSLPLSLCVSLLYAINIKSNANANDVYVPSISIAAEILKRFHVAALLKLLKCQIQYLWADSVSFFLSFFLLLVLLLLLLLKRDHVSSINLPYLLCIYL